MRRRVCVTPWNGRPDLWAAWNVATAPFDERYIVYTDWDGLPKEAKSSSAWLIDGNAVKNPSVYGELINEGIRYANVVDEDEIWVLNNDIIGEFKRPMLPDNFFVGQNIILTSQVRNPVEPHLEMSFSQVEGLPDIPYIDGWCIGAKKAAWDAIGDYRGNYMPGIKEGFQGFYYEDPYLSLKIAEAGLLIGTVNTGLRHIGGATTGMTPDSYANLTHNRNLVINRIMEMV